jgi:flagellar FliL protein
MRKNILTIIILAMCLINIVLSAILIFVMVPAANKTFTLVNKVAQIIDLELESPDSAMENISVSDIETYLIDERLTCLLANSDDEDHYAVFYMSSVSTKMI